MRIRENIEVIYNVIQKKEMVHKRLVQSNRTKRNEAITMQQGLKQDDWKQFSDLVVKSNQIQLVFMISTIEEHLEQRRKRGITIPLPING